VPKNAFVSPDLPKPAGPYSHVAEVNGLLFTAGFGPQNPATGEIPDGITAQTEQVLENVKNALAAAGATLADVVKVTVHLQNLLDDFAAFNEVYARYLPDPYPVRTTVGSQLFNILVEIDVVAVKP
jgi:2-iminobutanoate/2-iminopropanoate deaminase